MEAVRDGEMVGYIAKKLPATGNGSPRKRILGNNRAQSDDPNDPDYEPSLDRY